MNEVCGLSLDLVSIATAVSFRLSATSGYARLVDERMQSLAVEPVAGFPSLNDFTQRRYLPAVRTCEAMSVRLEQLSARAALFTSLLRTRIETRIENQNAQHQPLNRQAERFAREGVPLSTSTCRS